MNLFKRTAIIAGLALSLLGSALSQPAQAADLFAPDLIVSSTSQYVAANGQEVVQITVKNAGLGNAGAFKVNVAGTGGTNLNETKSFGGLAAGASSTFTHATGFTTSCTFTRTIKVDSTNLLAEAIESNNSKSVAATKCPRPDLKISAETYWSSMGTKEFQRITVKNVGTAPAGIFQIVVAASGGTNTGTMKVVNGLAVGASYTFDFMPMAACDYSMTATADSGKIINEFNESNNVVTKHDGCLK